MIQPQVVWPWGRCLQIGELSRYALKPPDLGRLLGKLLCLCLGDTSDLLKLAFQAVFYLTFEF